MNGDQIREKYASLGSRFGLFMGVMENQGMMKEADTLSLICDALKLMLKM